MIGTKWSAIWKRKKETYSLNLLIIIVYILEDKVAIRMYIFTNVNK